MSEKEPKQEIPEGLPEQLSSINKDMTEYMAGVRAEREKPLGVDIQEPLFTDTTPKIDAVAVGASAVRRLRLVGEDSDQTDVYADLGGGNPQKRRFNSLRANLLHNIEILETDGATYTNGERDIFKLVEGVKAVKGIFDYPGWNIEKSVSHAVNEFQKIGGEKYKRNRAVLIHDSLNMLQIAFGHVVKNSVTHERSEELVEQFTEEICPSGLWGDANLTDAMLESIDQAYEMVVNMTSSDPRSIEGFIKKTQLELLKRGLDINQTGGQTPEAKRGNKRRLSNARILAWQEWQEIGSETSA